MHSLVRLFGLLTLLLAFTATAASPETVSFGKQRAVANRVLARFKSDVAAAERAAALAGERGRVVREFTFVPGLVAIELGPKPTLNLVVPQPGKGLQTGKDLMQRIQSLMDTGAFEYVEPDFIVQIRATPTDTAYANGTLWGLKNNGQSGGVAGADIQAEQAWDITTGDPDVIVGVIDTGIRYTHQDLAARMWVNPGEIAGNGVDDDADGYVDNVHGINAILGTGDPMDDNDHGTHCAGTIGAQANGGGPHVGVAWNIRLMGLKFLDANGSGNTFDAIACVEFAVAEKARLPGVRMVLNNSWGGGGASQSLENAIIEARDANILFVAAAGNESNNNDANPSFPANYNVDNVISVAAVDRSNGLAGFSNYGSSTVHLGAPGVAIYSSTSGSDNQYQSFNGTSMATPHVSGVAALIWSAHPNASYAEVKQRLLVGTVPIPSLAGKTITGGRLNAFNSLNVAPDGSLEINVTAEGGLQVLPGTSVAIRVAVTDFGAINDAVVTGTLSTGGALSFNNNGTGPDQVPGDNVYSAMMTVPNNVSSFNLNVGATAPSKTPANTVVTFTVISPPPNDRFAQREVITSLPALRTGSNVNATSEAGEFDLDQNGQPGASIWWSWTAPQSGVAIATTDGSNIDTLLGVFTGNSLGALSLVDVNDDVTDAFTSSIVFPTQAGVTYHFHVDGYYAEQGAIQFNLTLHPSLANDNFANRTVINGGVEFAVNGYNLGASGEEPNEPQHNFYAPYRSVWWEWNNTDYAGPVYISTAGSSFDTHIAVYTGDSYQNLLWLAGNDDVLYEWPYYAILSSEVQFTAQIGRRYQIVVDSAQPETGTIRLTIARAPDNDNFNAPRILTGEFAQDFGNNIGATRQSGEPDYGSPALSAKSVWWRWTAPRSGNVVVTTDGSAFDTRIDVFTGSSVGNLTPVAFNEDRSSRVFTSLLNFGAVQGTTYRIRVDGYYYEVPDGVGGVAAHWVFSGSINLLLSMDGASQLGPPEVRDDNTLAFNFYGEPERPYVLSSSADFNQWTPVSTNTLVSRQILFSTPVVPGPHFYRAQPASLVGGK